MAIQIILWCTFVLAIDLAQILSHGNKCLKNGLYEHPKDCDKFYSCAPFGPVLMHCPAGLHFNPQYLVCDWPETAGCKQNKVEDLESNIHQACPVYPNPNDCTKYYLCSQSGAALIQCPENLHFNPKLSVCDWPQNVECIEEQISTTPLESTSVMPENTEIFSNESDTVTVTLTTIDQTDSSKKPAHLTTILSTTIVETHPVSINKTDSTQNFEFLETSTSFVPNQSNLPPLCKSNIEPHPKDCSKFFVCGSTGLIEYSCPEEMHFNPVLLVCDWPRNAGCQNIITEITTTEFAEITSATTQTTMDFSQNVTTEYILASSLGSEHLETTAIENTTPIDFSTAEEETTKNLIDTTSQDFEVTFVTTGAEATTQSADSAERCKANTWPHPDDCTKFVMSSAIGPLEASCPQQLHFNPKLLICDWPHNVRCENNSMTNTDFTTNEFDTTLFSNFVTTELIQAPSINMENFGPNTTEGLAITSESTTTYQTIGSTELCKGSIWPHPEDCTKFFQCGSTGAVEKFCPEGLHFNDVLLVCDWPHNAGCTGYLNAMTETIGTGVLTDELTDVSTITTNVSDNFITTDLVTGMDYLETTTLEDLDKTHSENDLSTTDTLSRITENTIITTEKHTVNTIGTFEETMLVSASDFKATPKSSQNREICQAQIWSYPNDCTRFFVCGDSGGVEKSCPEPLHFNPSSLVCDWPQNAGCALMYHEI